MLAFAYWLDNHERDDEVFTIAVETSLAYQTRRYRCSARVICQHYLSQILAIGTDEYFFGFRPELN
jgi:hypothetical protein